MPLRLNPTLREHLATTTRPLAGIWICSASPLIAEIVAGSGIDWALIDMEHSPNGLESILTQLQAVAPYPITPVVRVPTGDPIIIKQVLDLGAQNILVPMVSTPDHARDLVRAVRYPPHGIRGVGSALARSARWNRVDDYLTTADNHVSLLVQIETTTGIDAAGDIAAIDGIDGVFIGPSDLAASMGHIGQQTHPHVTAAIHRALTAIRATGTPAGINAFDPHTAHTYANAGATFILVGADVALLARSTETLATHWNTTHTTPRTSY